MIKKLSLIALLASTILPLTANAQLKYQEGIDYNKLSSSIEDSETPRVIEFFWFGCHHCNEVRSAVSEWVENDLPEDLEFELMPANLDSERWSRPAQAYYTMKMLDIDLFDAYFDAIFKDRKLGLLANDGEVKKFFVKNGVTPEAFDKAWESFEVKQQLQRARDLFEKSGIEGVPTFIVNGKYIVSLKGNDENAYKRMFDIIETLAK